MTRETVAMFRRALLHPEYGVNRQLDELELDPADARPRAVKRVLDPYHDDEAAKSNPGTEFPCVFATTSPYVLEGEVVTTKRDTSDLGLTIGLGVLLELPRMETAAGTVEAANLLRALMRCARALLSNERQADRTYLGYQMRDATRWDVLPNPVRLQDSEVVVACGLLVTVHVRDTNP